MTIYQSLHICNYRYVFLFGCSEKAWACELNGIHQRGRLIAGYIITAWMYTILNVRDMLQYNEILIIVVISFNDESYIISQCNA